LLYKWKDVAMFSFLYMLFPTTLRVKFCGTCSTYKDNYVIYQGDDVKMYYLGSILQYASLARHTFAFLIVG